MVIRGVLYICIFLVLSIGWNSGVSAQDSIVQKRIYSIQVQGGKGFLLAHRSYMRHLVRNHATSFELTLEKKVSGKKQFASTFGYPNAGFTFTIQNPGHREYIGLTYGLFPYIALPLGKAKGIPSLKLGAGIGVISKPFHQQQNHKNVAIGSYINAIINISLEGSIAMDRLHWNYGLGLIHYSNGAFSAPNLGLNIPMLKTGFTYDLITNHKYKEPEMQLAIFRKQTGHEVFGLFGFRENSLHDPKKYMAGSLTYQYLRQFRDKFGYTVGSDFFYNSSIKYKEDSDGQTGKSNFQWGGFAGMEMIFDDVSLFVNQGFYLYTDYKMDGKIYQRIGVRKRFKWGRGLLAHVALRTHVAVAQYVEFGIGYHL